MPRNSVRQSCNPCKERHLRCDREQPSCSNCRKSKYLLNCSYEPVKFKFRTSLITPPRKNVSERIRPSDPQASPPNLTPQNCREPSGGPPSPSIGSPSRSESGDLQESLDSLATRPRPPIQDAPVDTSMLVDENLASVPLSATCFPNTPSLSNPPITNVQQHATPDKTEAYIYNFYLQTAGPWVSQTTHLENVELRAENSKLDIVSPNRFFGIHVPQVAVNEPALFSACLAYAAQVLYLHGRIPSEIKTSLHDRAVTQLTPLLTSFHEGHPLGSILASTVLLRMTEQFLEIGEDHQHHLYGGSTLFQICLDEWSLFDDSLSSTSFWAYLRGSIRVSFMLERPSPCELGRLNTLQNLFTNNNNNMTDEAYANVMTYLLAEICTVVWGEPTSAVDVASKMKHLKTAIYEWRDQLPASFQPWYVEFSENDTFPDVRHLASWHCVGWQFFYTAQIMLAVFSPEITSELNVFRLTRAIEEKIATPTRWLCGTTISSPDYGVKLNGSHLIAWSAQFVTGKTEQAAVLNMLMSLWEETRWPNQTSCSRLRGLWNNTRQHWMSDNEAST